MPGPREIELKIVIPDAAAVERLVQALEARGARRCAPVLQTNHFFDTAEHDLRRARLALRLREAGGAWRLTLKGATTSRSDALTERPEVEVEVDAADARALLAGSRSAPALFLELSADVDARVREELRARSAGVAVGHLGSFSNERTRVGPLVLEEVPEPLWFELDRSEFPGERVDREAEVELSDAGHAEAVEAALRRLFAEVGIDWATAPSKAKRFFAALEGAGG